MKKYKICVYAISKNEEKFVDRWYESMKDADDIYVLDTGSTDNTVKLLEDRGVNVCSKIIVPWRFDTARNISLSFVPCDADICVCTDLDEVFIPGWREVLERVWESNTNRIKYIYNWSLDNDNNPRVSFYYDKIHSRNGYEWIYPVHEVLKCSLDKENCLINDEIVLNHYPDSSKSRGSYLELLEQSVLEDKTNDRNMHYLGREYMYHGRWQEAIDTLKQHLSLYNATWKDERCASMRFISRCYIQLENYNEAYNWLEMAIIEAPKLRDSYVEMAFLKYYLEDYEQAISYLTKAIMIKTHEKTYINEVFSWDNTIDDLFSICYYNLGLYDIALFFSSRALEYDKKNERLLKNYELIYKKSKE